MSPHDPKLPRQIAIEVHTYFDSMMRTQDGWVTCAQAPATSNLGCATDSEPSSTDNVSWLCSRCSMFLKGQHLSLAQYGLWAAHFASLGYGVVNRDDNPL